MDGSISIGRKGAGLRPFVQVFGPHVMDMRISDGAFRTLLLLDLLEGADREGVHNIALIAKMRETSDRTVERHIKELKEATLIEIEYYPGKTSKIYILEPLDIYGRAAISSFYLTVQKINKGLREGGRGTTSGRGTPDKNDTPPPTKMTGVPPTKMTPPKPRKTSATTNNDKDLQKTKFSGTENRGTEEEGTESFGALSPSAPTQNFTPLEEKIEIRVEGEPLRLEDCAPTPQNEARRDPIPEEPKKEGTPCQRGSQVGETAFQEGIAPDKGQKPPQTVCKPFTSARGGSGIIIPGENTTEEGGIRRKAKKLEGDTEKDPNEWNCQDSIKYFRDKYKEAWRGEGSPPWGTKDMAAVKGRLTWLENEEIGVGMMKKVIDHLFAGWSNGLPARFKWGSRPGLALIEDIRLFERLVREVQGGVTEHGRVDDYKDKTAEDKVMIEKYAEKNRVCVELMDGGMGQWEAEKEAKRRVGL